MSVLELRGIRKTYHRGPEKVEALRGVDLTVSAGEITAIIGSSGCGKTTLLNIIGGVDRPDAGEVWVEGTRIDHLPEASRTELRRTRIGMIFQDFLLVPHLTAIENVRLPLHFSGQKRDAGDLLERCEVGTRRHFYPHQLSGGEQQRVAIARALVHKPSLLLADEPTGALDSEQAGRLWELLRSLAVQDSLAITLATHNAELAHSADCIHRLRDGLITPAAVHSDTPPRHLSSPTSR